MFKTVAVFHKIEISNNGYIEKEIKLSIKPLSDRKMNFYLPESKLQKNITRYDGQIFYLQKNNPDEDLGDYIIDFYLAKQKKPIVLQNNIDAFQPIPIAQPVSTESSSSID